jgi:hypothetical protein
MTILAGLAVTYLGAAAFLTCREPPAHADAVVLFIGPDYAERRKEARQLLEQGYADLLLIPALKSTLVMADNKLVKAPFYIPMPSSVDRSDYPAYYENTHIEALKARQMMESLGLTSAILVSSPYHMKRISIIARQVFSHEKYRLAFRGSRHVPPDRFPAQFTLTRMRQVLGEYIKIGWLYGYSFYEGTLSKTIRNA